MKHLDKWAHFMGNLWVVLIASLMGQAGVGVWVAGMVSGGKEVRDYRRDGSVNWLDALADIIGILTGLGIWQLVELV